MRIVTEQAMSHHSHLLVKSFGAIHIHDPSAQDGDVATKQFVLDTVRAATGGTVPAPGPAPSPTPAPLTAGAGIAINAGQVSVTAAQPTITSLGDLTGLTVTGTAHLDGRVTIRDPVDDIEPASKGYVSSVIPKVGRGITLNGDAFDINASLPHVTSFGPLQGLTVSGPAVFASTITVRNPVDGGDAANRQFVTQAVRAGGGIAYETPAEGAEVVIPVDRGTVVLNPAGPLAALTLTFPVSAVDGASTTVTSTQDVAALTLNNAPFTFGGASAALTAHTAVTVVYSADAASYFVR
jgi:hypothetical protein